MAGKKRKAAGDVPDSRPARRQSGRARKAEVKYNESDIEEAHSDGEYKADADNQAHSDAEFKADSDEASEGEGVEEASESDDEYASNLKKKGWTKKKGEDGRWQMVIDVPTAKDPGGIPYRDDRIHPNTMEFLKDLKKNNQREWLKFHDAPYRQAEKDFQTFVTDVSAVVSEIDPTIPELPIKDIIFRIYRDMRFSPDPTPYKPYFSVAWSRTGRKGPYAHYYLHIQPNGESFLGGGYYACDNATLACIREDIDLQPQQFKSILMNDNLRQTFFSGVSKDEKKVVAAFCAMSGENALKKMPKGYAIDHRDIALLKLKGFTLRRSISDEEITSENGLGIVSDMIAAIEPFITYLNHTVLPDRG
ncbi:hypothetical protein BP6252_04926 [Coleophoma cylindrospora]|uniref:DUF2461 domain-containing protein n=1 Tax=Coleophoma cylindrospora TaxID=1849047 RepID=A0A3D8S1Z4_9HELO|nr:hypothetical protein BP6252_04926 [Coleophoma cylindrospora]